MFNLVSRFFFTRVYPTRSRAGVTFSSDFIITSKTNDLRKNYGIKTQLKTGFGSIDIVCIHDKSILKM